MSDCGRQGIPRQVIKDTDVQPSAYDRLRPLLFRLDPELAHDLTLRLLSLSSSLPPVRRFLRHMFCFSHPSLRVHAFGLDFPNPVGLAAGYDKEGRAIQGLASLGFGHLEIGTITPMAQVGNPLPRIFRLPEDEAIINRMGFPNAGPKPLLDRLRKGRPRGIVLGINIGKGMATPLSEAVGDYLFLLKAFYPYADYFTVNVSSPNTIGLRRLQARSLLESLLSQLDRARQVHQRIMGRRIPILVKLAPDLSDGELVDAIEAILNTGMDGVIATNTTVARHDLRSQAQGEAGGLSGKPLRRRTLEVVHRIDHLTNGRLPIIGVGGISSPRDAQAMLDAGATLIQVYTGLVYRGPGLARTINQGLINRNGA